MHLLTIKEQRHRLYRATLKCAQVWLAILKISNALRLVSKRLQRTRCHRRGSWRQVQQPKQVAGACPRQVQGQGEACL